MKTSSAARRHHVRHLLSMSLLLTMLVAGAMVLGALTGFAATPASGKSSVAIKDFTFRPATLRVKAGTKIKIMNRDDTTHTFTADHGAFDAGKISPGKQATVTVKKPGTYKYHCEIHDYMKGTIKAT